MDNAIDESACLSSWRSNNQIRLYVVKACGFANQHNKKLLNALHHVCCQTFINNIACVGSADSVARKTNHASEKLDAIKSPSATENAKHPRHTEWKKRSQRIVLNCNTLFIRVSMPPHVGLSS